MLFLKKVIGSFAAAKEDPGSLLVILIGLYLEQIHLPRPFDVGRTAGADINAGDRDEPEAFGVNFLFAAPGKLLLLFRRRKRGSHGQILPDDPIGSLLQLSNLFLFQPPVKVHGNLVVSQMKTDVMITIAVIHQTGKNMFTRMLLHLVIAILKVQFGKDFRTRLEHLSLMPGCDLLLLSGCLLLLMSGCRLLLMPGCSLLLVPRCNLLLMPGCNLSLIPRISLLYNGMDEDAVLQTHLRHPKRGRPLLPDPSRITGLSPCFRKKGRLIQNQVPASIRKTLAGKHSCPELPAIGVLIVKLLRRYCFFHHALRLHFLSNYNPFYHGTHEITVVEEHQPTLLSTKRR